MSGIQIDVIFAVDGPSQQLLQSSELIISDQYRLESLQSVLPNALSDRRTACKLRFVDFWGTPPEQNHIQFDLKQFLVPYPNPWNEFLGFSQHPIASRPADDVPMLLLHGKLGRYFQSHLRVIEALTEFYDVVATVPSQQLDGLQFPPRVTNVGICNSTIWEELLSRSSAVIGFGDPVLAPTALESIAAGSPYIFAKYAQPRSLMDLPAHPIRSQHDFMLRIGPPYAYAVDVSDHDSVLETVQIAIRNPIESWIPSEYRASQYAERVRAILDTNLCSNI